MIPVTTSDGIDFSGGATLGYCPNYLKGKTSAEIFIVLKAAADPNPGANNLWDMGKSDGSTAYPDGSGNITDDWGSTTLHTIAHPATSLTEYALYNVRSTPTEWTAYLDNVKVFTTPTNTVGFPDEMRIGGGVIVLEIAIYSPALSEADRLSVGNAIAYRNGLSWATPPAGSTPEPGTDPDPDFNNRLPPDPIPATAGPRPFGISLFRRDWDHFGEAPFNAYESTYLSPSELLDTLAKAQAKGYRVSACLTPNSKIIVNGVFSFNAYKACAEQYRNVDLSPYIDDGTLIGIYVIDEPNHKTRWGLANGIPMATVDDLCAIWKGMFPKAKTLVRSTPVTLSSYTNWRFLDCAWCNYSDRFGDVNAYIQHQKKVAQQLGLRIMWGLNCINGGTDDRSSPLFFNRQSGSRSDWYNMGPAAIRSYGTAICSETYSEGFIPWMYDSDYMALSGMRDAWTAVRAVLDRTFTNEPTPAPPTGSTFFMADAESGSLTPWNGPTGVTGAGLVPVTSETRAKNGTKSYKLEIAASATDSSSTLTANSPTATMQGASGHFASGYYSFWAYIDAGFNNNASNRIFGWLTGGESSPVGYLGLERWTNNGATRGGDLQLVFLLNNCATGQYACPLVSGYRQDSGMYKMTTASPNGIVVFPRQQWVHVSVYYKMSATNGQVTIWQDATKIMDLAAPTMNTFGGATLTNAAGDLVIQQALACGPEAETRRLYVDDVQVTSSRVT